MKEIKVENENENLNNQEIQENNNINHEEDASRINSIVKYWNTHCDLPWKKLAIGAVIVLLLEFLLWAPLDYVSMSIQVKTNRLISCETLEKMMFFEYNGKLIFYVLLLQYSNIYQCFLFWFSSNSVPFIMAIIKLIFRDVRPFWVNTDLEPCLCATNYGSPSTSTFNIIPLTLIVYNAPYNTEKYTYLKEKWFKVGLVIALILWNIIVPLVRFLQNAHSLNQLLFGAVCGWGIYYLFMDVLCLSIKDDENNEIEKFNYLYKNGVKLGIYLFAIFLVGILVIYLFPDSTIPSEIEMRLEEACPNSFAYLVLYSYAKSCSLLTNITMIVFFWIDFNYIYKGDESKFEDETMNEGSRFNNNLPWWNIFVKFFIMLAILVYVYDGLIVIRRDSRLNLYFWFTGPFIDSIILGFFDVFGVKHLFDILRLNNPKLIEANSNQLSERELINDEEKGNSLTQQYSFNKLEKEQNKKNSLSNIKEDEAEHDEISQRQYLLEDKPAEEDN